MKFSPKRDIWLSFIIWITVGICIVSGLIPLFVEGAGGVGGIFTFLICFTVASFVMWIWLGTYYVLTETDLYIRCGPLRWTIPYEKIIKVHPIRSVLSSAATSIQRLEIHYNHYDFIHISPLEEELFLSQLHTHGPHIQMDKRTT